MPRSSDGVTILRGRVISLYALAWSGFVPIGNLQAGAVAERFGAAASLWVGAAGIAATLLVFGRGSAFANRRPGDSG